jgi:hypothetical protein
MPRFRIYWDIGYGEMEGEIEAKDFGEAVAMAYNVALEEFESRVDYGAEEISDGRSN